MWEVPRYPEVAASGDLIVRAAPPDLAWHSLAEEPDITRVLDGPVVLGRPDAYIYGVRILAVIFADRTPVAVEVCDEGLWWGREITGIEVEESDVQRYPIEDVYVLSR